MHRLKLQFFIVTVLLASLLLPAASISASTVQQAGPYLTANQAVYVRGGPGIGFYVVGTLYPGEIAPVLGVSPDFTWWYVRTTFGEGWVFSMEVTPTNTATVAVRDPGAMAYVPSGVVNVRSGAGPTASVLGQLGHGQQVLVIGQSADGAWLQIKWAYGTGWIAANLVSATGVAAVVNDGGVPVTSEDPYGVVLTAFLNVRSGPGVNYASIGQLTGGTSINIIGRSSDSQWYQIETVWGDGWVFAPYVLTRNEYGGSPVITPESDAAVTGPIGIVNAGTLNLRSGPGAQYTSLGTLVGGTETQIIGRTNDWSWFLLITPIGTGWASDLYIIARGDISGVPYVAPGGVVPEGDGQGGGEAPLPAESATEAVVSTGALHIRSGPNSAFSSIGTVYAGTRLPILGQSADRGWWYVLSDFGTGWVTKLYTLTYGDTSAIPVVTP